MAAKKSKKPIKITRPGALTAQKKPGESMRQAAQRLKKSGTTQQKREANLYLNVLAPANAKKRKKPKKK